MDNFFFFLLGGGGGGGGLYEIGLFLIGLGGGGGSFLYILGQDTEWEFFRAAKFQIFLGIPDIPDFFLGGGGRGLG